MPLKRGRSNKVIRSNYLTERRHGKSTKQSWAISYRKAGRSR